MIALLQRVSSARVEVRAECVGEIGRGLLVFIGVQKGDTEQIAEKLLDRITRYRVFPDNEDRMNLSLVDVAGALLLVSQFTLAADTGKGLRPSFSKAAPPDEGKRLFRYLLNLALQKDIQVASGRFGENMQVSLVNDGPVTFWLEV